MPEVQDLPNEDDLYLQRRDCTQDQVNTFIRLGYNPWQVTPVTEIVHRADGKFVSQETHLVYHFIRRKTQ